jgi:hypothetical protein
LVHAQVTGTVKTYTTDADFDLGTLFNVNHNAPNNNQLQLNTQLTTFPIMWIANAGEDTLSKFNTTTNTEVGRYYTDVRPFGHLNNAYAGPAPSRTAVDSQGNAYVANRHFDGLPPSVMKILADGFVDRNGDGVMQTSTNSTPLPLNDTNGNGMVDVGEIQDERIAWWVRVGPANGLGRSLCIDPTGDLWVGMYNSRQYWKISGSTGATLAGPISTGTHTPYGCVVDSSGMLWSASLSNSLGQLNTVTGTYIATHFHTGSDYGIAQGNGKVYQSNGSFAYTQFDPATNTFSTPASVFYDTTGIAVDSAGMMLAGQFGGVVRKFNATVAAPHPLVWTGPAGPGTSGAHGTIVDSAGDVWRINLYSHNITKYNGTTGALINTFPIGNSPYTYSDATGLSFQNNTSPSGNWRVTQDGGDNGHPWGIVRWNTEAQGSVPAGSSIAVEARTADTQGALGAAAFTPVSNNAVFNQNGRYIEVRATLTANSSGQSPILSDLTLRSLQCDIDADGDVDRNDVAAITAARNTPASGPTDRRDPNHSGIIDVNDARFCSVRCTRPSCAP